MFENKYPLFKTGNPLLKEDLDLLRDNPEEIFKLMYINNKDGIIKGFGLITDLENRKVTVTGGIIKYNGRLYWMKENYNFSMPEKENRYILKLKLFPIFEERKYYIKKGEFVLETLGEVRSDEMEIARFITREGAELRNDYQNFHDLKRDFNLLEIINSKYSSTHIMGTFHPLIMRLWGKEAVNKENLDIFDINFYTVCFQGIVERDTIIFYVNRKLNLKREDYSNDELYQYLSQILDEMGKERKIEEKKRIKPKKITVD